MSQRTYTYTAAIDHDRANAEHEALRGKLATAVADYCHYHQNYPQRVAAHQQRLAAYEQQLANYRKAKWAHDKRLALENLDALGGELSYQYGLD